MKEIAEMLKTFGPNYDLRFRTSYFGPSPGLRIELFYFDIRLNVTLKKSHDIPFDQVEHLNDHGPQIVEDMFHSVHAKLREAWGG